MYAIQAHDDFTPLGEVDQPRSKLRLQIFDHGKFQTRQVVGHLARCGHRKEGFGWISRADVKVAL